MTGPEESPWGEWRERKGTPSTTLLSFSLTMYRDAEQHIKLWTYPIPLLTEQTHPMPNITGEKNEEKLQPMFYAFVS